MNWSSFSDRVSQERFFRRIDIDPDEAKRKLRRSSVAIKQLIDLDVSPLCLLLRSFGIKVNHTPADLVVSVTETYLTSSRLDRVVEESLRAGRPSLILQPTGITSLMGPLLDPKSHCWPCLKKVLSRHHPIPESLQILKQSDEKITAPSAYLSSTLSLYYAFAAQAIVLFLVKGSLPQLEQHIYSFNNHTLKQHTHYIVPWISCSTCRAKQKPFLPQPPVLQLDQPLHAIEGAATDVT